jgi:hypothetical protein
MAGGACVGAPGDVGGYADCGDEFADGISSLESSIIDSLAF